MLRRQVTRIVVTLVMDAFVLISGFSIKKFYLPANFVMLLAAWVEDTAQFRDCFDEVDATCSALELRHRRFTWYDSHCW